MPEHDDDRPPGRPGPLHRVENVLTYASGAAVVLIMILTLIDVAGRTFFRQPLTGTYETVEGFLLVAAVWLGLSRGERYKEHVGVDILVQKVSPRVRLLITAIPLTLVGAIFGYLAYAGFERAIDRWDVTTSTTVIPLPAGATWLVVALGSAVLGIRIVVDVVSGLVRAETTPAEAEEEKDRV
ncbi:TRAP transporter small permease [Prauserella cavernicola]|uniref:TRAP transporter small permease n=1 Tax=Prauserella cavernicola TaxID=2800127 RepID=A0A934VA20_9PSEU|nr:TRAP transporter small permease [Prauserella cavernicola]MBK1789448.1 TRAP transporter small permease [Prauserella cavernicola]